MASGETAMVDAKADGAKLVGEQSITAKKRQRMPTPLYMERTCKFGSRPWTYAKNKQARAGHLLSDCRGDKNSDVTGKGNARVGRWRWLARGLFLVLFVWSGRWGRGVLSSKVLGCEFIV